jgi:hypothetical protein
MIPNRKKNVFRIGGNTFYDWKFEIPMNIPEFKRSGIGLIAEFCGIPHGFLNLDDKNAVINQAFWEWNKFLWRTG